MKLRGLMIDIMDLISLQMCMQRFLQKREYTILFICCNCPYFYKKTNTKKLGGCNAVIKWTNIFHIIQLVNTPTLGLENLILSL